MVYANKETKLQDTYALLWEYHGLKTIATTVEGKNVIGMEILERFKICIDTSANLHWL